MYTYPRPSPRAYARRVLSGEGRFSRALRSGTERKLGRGGVTQAGRMRRPRLWFAPTDSGGPGKPTGPTTGLCLEWLDGAGARGRKPSGSWRKPLLVLEARTPGTEIAAAGR